MIDLHLHTTASDGVDTPARLVHVCRAAGITTIGVTDHDTMDGVAEAASAAQALGVTLVPGIEFTAAWRDRDVHILGYFLDAASDRLAAFLTDQRTDRIRRARLIGERLARLDAPIDMEALIRSAKGRPVLRPAIAQALVSAGHVANVQEAFDRFIGEDAPAFAPRAGATPADVVALVAGLGGRSSMAHPGLTRQDDLIPDLVSAGLDALEAFHPDHSAEDTSRYQVQAQQLGLAVTGGSDFHGESSHHAHGFGVVTLPSADFEAFRAR